MENAIDCATRFVEPQSELIVFELIGHSDAEESTILKIRTRVMTRDLTLRLTIRPHRSFLANKSQETICKEGVKATPQSKPDIDSLSPRVKVDSFLSLFFERVCTGFLEAPEWHVQL